MALPKYLWTHPQLVLSSLMSFYNSSEKLPHVFERSHYISLFKTQILPNLKEDWVLLILKTILNLLQLCDPKVSPACAQCQGLKTNGTILYTFPVQAPHQPIYQVFHPVVLNLWTKNISQKMSITGIIKTIKTQTLQSGTQESQFQIRNAKHLHIPLLSNINSTL